MTTLAVTTVCRDVPTDAPSGCVVCVDLERWKVVRRCEVAKPRWHREDDNSHGGLRGAKGLAVTPTKLWIANFSAVYGFDASWRLRTVASHPSCGGIHEIAFHDGYLWVCSTRNDRLIRFDESGGLVEHLEPGSIPAVRRGLRWQPRRILDDAAVRAGRIDFRDPRTQRMSDYDHLHLNSLRFLPDGTMLTLCGMCWTRGQIVSSALKDWLERRGYWQSIVGGNRRLLRLLRRKPPLGSELIASPAKGRGAVVRFAPDGTAKVVLILEHIGMPAHSLLPEPEGTVLFTDTSSGCLVRFCPERKMILSRVKLTDGFLRGLALVDAETLLVGDRNRLLRLEGRVGGRESLRGSLTISDDPREAIFDIAVIPQSFAPMPPELFAGAPSF